MTTMVAGLICIAAGLLGVALTHAALWMEQRIFKRQITQLRARVELAVNVLTAYVEARRRARVGEPPVVARAESLVALTEALDVLSDESSAPITRLHVMKAKRGDYDR